jgi:hypothetical protein
MIVCPGKALSASRGRNGSIKRQRMLSTDGGG